MFEHKPHQSESMCTQLNFNILEGMLYVHIYTVHGMKRHQMTATTTDHLAVASVPMGDGEKPLENGNLFTETFHILNNDDERKLLMLMRQQRTLCLEENLPFLLRIRLYMYGMNGR